MEILFKVYLNVTICCGFKFKISETEQEGNRKIVNSFTNFGLCAMDELHRKKIAMKLH